MRRGLDFKKKARIIIVDDNYDHLSGIKELIEIESDFDVVATATSASVAISLIKKYRPEIVLMDINMPEKDGLTAIAEIEKLDLGVRIIALTGYDDPDLIFRAMKIGAKGYILKTMASAQLIYAIDEVAAGKIYLPAALSSRFFEYFQQSFKEETQVVADEENLLNYLTQREEEVLDLLTQGITYKGVAQKLFISETTVKTHVNNIFQKLQVNDRTQAVLYALNNGFLNRRKVKIAI
ncbi:TPA: DNA-binding response regulator [Candidatus Gastranaerophilales bacterium HUM_21]|nr:MAG TPA: DNA-binding response regulator [Candidatus Gastranaerophilales bacterium HUM_21]